MTVFHAFTSPEVTGAAGFHDDLELNLAVLKKFHELGSVHLLVDKSVSTRFLISNLKNILGKINANVYEFLIFQNFCGIHIAALFNLETGAVYPTSVSFFLKFQNLILLPARNFSFSSAVSSSNRGFRQVPSFSASRHLHHIPCGCAKTR
jgi:hypothetical protein